MKTISLYLFAFIVIIGMAYGGWQLKRWWNYKFSYQSQVQAEMQPLAKRIADLERRVSVLETNKSR